MKTILPSSLLMMSVVGAAHADLVPGPLQRRLDAIENSFKAKARRTHGLLGQNFQVIGSVHKHSGGANDHGMDVINGESGILGSGYSGNWSQIESGLTAAQKNCFAGTLEALSKALPDLPTGKSLANVAFDFRIFANQRVYNDLVKTQEQMYDGMVIFAEGREGESAKIEDGKMRRYLEKGILSQSNGKSVSLILSGAYFIDNGSCLKPSREDILAALKNPIQIETAAPRRDSPGQGKQGESENEISHAEQLPHS